MHRLVAVVAEGARPRTSRSRRRRPRSTWRGRRALPRADPAGRGRRSCRARCCRGTGTRSSGDALRCPTAVRAEPARPRRRAGWHTPAMWRRLSRTSSPGGRGLPASVVRRASSGPRSAIRAASAAVIALYRSQVPESINRRSRSRKASADGLTISSQANTAKPSRVSPLCPTASRSVASGIRKAAAKALARFSLGSLPCRLSKMSSSRCTPWSSPASRWPSSWARVNRCRYGTGEVASRISLTSSEALANPSTPAPRLVTATSALKTSSTARAPTLLRKSQAEGAMAFRRRNDSG